MRTQLWCLKILDRRRHLRRNPSTAFGLVELMVTMVVLSIVMLGAYKFFVKSNRATSVIVKKTLLERQAVALKDELERSIRNMGQNPTLKEYDTDPPDNDNRFGLTTAGPGHVRFQSDDNGRYYPATSQLSTGGDPALIGIIQEGERYGFWIVPSLSDIDVNNATTTYAARVDFSQRVDSQAEATPCTPNPTKHFNNPHMLVKLKKDYRSYDPSSDNLWTSPTAPTNALTMPQVVADNVVCFSYRYYSFNDDLSKWERVMMPPQAPAPPIPFLPLPEADGSYLNVEDYKTIRDIGRIEIGVVLIDMDTTSNKIDRISGNHHPTKKIHIDIRLPNIAWHAGIISPLDSNGDPLLIPGTGS